MPAQQSSIQAQQQPAAVANRPETFHAAIGSQALADKQSAYDASAPRAFHPDSPTLEQHAPSANGLGASDASRRLAVGTGMLPTGNGRSVNQLQAASGKWAVQIGNAPA